VQAPLPLRRPSQTSQAQQHALSGRDINGRPISLQSSAGKLCLVTFFTAGCNQILKREGLFQAGDWDDLWLSLG
jgi:hypothetical protein